MFQTLFFLLRLQTYAAIRRTWHEVRTPHGAVFMVLGLVSLALWIIANVHPDLALQRTDVQTVRAIAPFVLLAICILTVVTFVGERAVYFSPSEIDFLFAGPFTQRELLSYKLGKGFLAAATTALLCSVVSIRYVSSWLAGYIGFMLSLVFIQLLSTAVLLIAQTLAAGARSRLRKLCLFALLIVVAWTVVRVVLSGEFGRPLDVIDRIRQSWVRYFLVVFDAFGQTMTAARIYPDLIKWSALSLLINVGLLALVLKLEVNYQEAALESSRRAYDAMQRARRLGAIVDIAARGPVRWRLPAFPWFGGSGPIAWRQLTNALRNSAGILRLLLLMFATVGPILIAALIRGNPAGFLSGALTWLIVFVPLMFRFDFRSDLSHMDWLKMMPLRPIAIALGEMAPPVLLTSLVQVMLVSLLALVMPDARTLLSVAALFTLPFNALLFSVENFLFLLFPAPFGAGAPGSFQFFGRQVALLFTKFLLLAPCCAVASVLGAVGFLICGEVWMVFGIVSWLVVALEAGLVVLGVAWCYRRFDLSLNMPIT